MSTDKAVRMALRRYFCRLVELRSMHDFIHSHNMAFFVGFMVIVFVVVLCEAIAGRPAKGAESDYLG